MNRLVEQHIRLLVVVRMIWKQTMQATVDPVRSTKRFRCMPMRAFEDSTASMSLIEIAACHADRFRTAQASSGDLLGLTGKL